MPVVVLYKCKEKHVLPSQGGREENVSWHLKRIGNGGRKLQALGNTPGGIGYSAAVAGKYKSEKHCISLGIQ